MSIWLGRFGPIKWVQQIWFDRFGFLYLDWKLKTTPDFAGPGPCPT